MFVRPIDNIVTSKAAESIKNVKFISAYELIPCEKLKAADVVIDRFVAREQEILQAPKSVLDSITRIFW